MTDTMIAERRPVTPIRPVVNCPHCNAKVFDGLVIRARTVRVLASGAEAKCRCREWVRVPVVYKP